MDRHPRNLLVESRNPPDSPRELRGPLECAQLSALHPVHDRLRVSPKRPNGRADRICAGRPLSRAPRAESNHRHHPYHGTTRNRCAPSRFPRSRPTVGSEVIGSPSVKLCAHSHQADPLRASRSWQLALKRSQPVHREGCRRVLQAHAVAGVSGIAEAPAASRPMIRTTGRTTESGGDPHISPPTPTGAPPQACPSQEPSLGAFFEGSTSGVADGLGRPSPSRIDSRRAAPSASMEARSTWSMRASTEVDCSSASPRARA